MRELNREERKVADLIPGIDHVGYQRQHQQNNQRQQHNYLHTHNHTVHTTVTSFLTLQKGNCVFSVRLYGDGMWGF